VFGLALIIALLVLLILLPLTTSMRVLRLTREIEELREHVALLQQQLQIRTGPAPPPPSSLSAHEAGGDAVPVAVPPLAAALQPPLADSPVDIPPLPPVVETEARREVPPQPEDLEERIGGRGLLYAGVLVLLFGVSFFLKYAFDNEWIDETGRVLLGALGGVALIGGGVRLSHRGLGAFGQALIGTGLAILYLAIYAALTFYALIGNAAAFGLMILVSVTAAILADRERSQALAFIAVGGGFLTPFLVGGREDAQLALFTYDAVLIAGTVFLAGRHDWHALNAVSYLLTFVTVATWMAMHYRERVWLRTLLFLTLYCVMFIQILRDTRRAKARVARFVIALLATAPFFYHIAAIVLSARHPPAIHVYLIAFTAAGLLLTAEPHRPGLRLLLLAAAYVPLFGDITLPHGLSWVIANTITIVSIAALSLLAPLDRVFRQEQRLRASELLTLHVAAIGVYALLYRTLGAIYPDWRGAIGVALAIGASALWRALRGKDDVAAINACALAFTLIAIAIAIQFDGPAVVVGWAAEGAAATWIGLRVTNRWFQIGGLALWALAIAKLLDGYFETPTRFVAVLNMRAATTAFVVFLGYALAWMYGRHQQTALHSGRTRAALHVATSVLTVIWITAEVGSYWSVRFETPQAHLYEQLYLSLGWGLYGALMIVVGMRRAYPPDRYIGITVLAITVLKVFFYDLWELGGIYRVIGFIVVGVLLLAVSYLYQKRRLPPARSEL
jgi:uncharacterized membrane protein